MPKGSGYGAGSPYAGCCVYSEKMALCPKEVVVLQPKYIVELYNSLLFVFITRPVSFLPILLDKTD